MTTYTIVALPQHDLLEKLNAIRTYLYTNDFRYTNKAPKDNAHITLAQVEINDDQDMKKIKQKFQRQLVDQMTFEISPKEIVSREHKRVEVLAKYPN